MNYPYKKFRAKAEMQLKESLQKANEILSSIGLKVNYDEGFPWTGEFKEAVGRCGNYTEEVHFDISIHFRAIYQTIHDVLSDSWWPEHQRDREIKHSISDTVFHEVAHGIFRTFNELTYEDDNLWNWCVENGFDKTLFIDKYEPDFEETLCEEYALFGNHSIIGKFITAYAKNYL